MRVVRGSTVTVVTDPFAAAPTGLSATVTRADGTALAAPTVTAEGLRAVIALTGTPYTSALDRLAVSVTATVAGSTAVQRFVVDVVDADYFTIQAVRMESGLADSGRFPDPLIAAHRDGLIDYVEHAAGRSFVPRYGIERHTTPRSRYLLLDHLDPIAVRAVRVDGTALTGPHTLHGDSVLVDGWPSGHAVEVHLEHGMAAPPGRLVTEMLRCLRRDLLARGAQAPSDTIWETVEGNTVRYSTPDFAAGRPTGVLGLDAVINAYRAPVGIA